MAKKKKHSHKAHRRSGRRVSGKSLGIDFAELSGAIAGAVASGLAKRALDKTLSSVNPMYKSVGVLGVGALLPRFVKNNTFVKGFSMGIVAAESLNVIKTISPGLIGYVGGDDTMTLDVTDAVNGVGGYGDDIPALAGVDDDFAPVMNGIGDDDDE